MGKFLIGWEEVNITPEKEVCLCGQFHARVSEGIKDPIKSTILVFESLKDRGNSEYIIMVSCDLVAIPSQFKNTLIEKVKKILPEIKEEKIIMNATHTHTAPEPGGDIIRGIERDSIIESYGIELPVMKPVEYINFATERIAEGIKNAWEKRTEGGISYGLGFAVVGHNRRISYYDGTSKMYGKTDDPNFSHVEGYEDHSINLMATYDKDKNLTGLIVNIACPSQVSESEFLISADFWHDIREELRKRFGEKLYIFAQCSSAGDQSPHILINKKAEERMWNLSGRNQRQEIGIRVANGIEEILPVIKKEINYNPVFSHICKKVKLTRYKISEEELNFCLRESEKYYKEYERLKKELEENPEKKKENRWYTLITSNYRRSQWYLGVKGRYESQKIDPKVEIEIHVLRIGDVVFATNPFECYLDYGMRIKARSKAIQTFIVQLAGSGTYLPTERALKGGSYSAVAPSCIVGPDGGKELVEETLLLIDTLFK